MPIHDAYRSFKAAFRLSSVDGRSPDLLTHRDRIPSVVREDPRILAILENLDTKLDTLQEESLEGRKGKKVLMFTHTRDKGSSIKKVSDELGKKEVDLDVLADVKGKGTDPAKEATRLAMEAEEALHDVMITAMLEASDEEEDPVQSLELLRRTVSLANDPVYGSDERRAKVVLAAAAALAEFLSVSMSALRGMSDTGLRAAYIDAVYAKFMIEKRAAKDTGARGKLDRLLSDVRLIDNATVPEGETRDLHKLLLDSGVGFNVVMNSSRAGKFSSGEVEEVKLKPDVEGWPEGLTIPTKGNEDFRDMVQEDLEEMAGTPAGKLLLEALKATGKEILVQVPSVANAKRIDDNGDVQYSNSSSNGKVSYDPENDIVGDGDGTGVGSGSESEAWRTRDPAISLYHEMIHALIASRGGESWSAKNNKDLVLKMGDQGENTELRIVGIKLITEIDGQRAVFPFDDPSYNPITENQYRISLAKSRSEDFAWLRPYYANVEGQQKISNPKVVF